MCELLIMPDCRNYKRKCRLHPIGYYKPDYVHPDGAHQVYGLPVEFKPFFDLMHIYFDVFDN